MLVAIFACLLIYIATLTHAGGTDIPLDFYTDNACATPSTTAANISLEIGVCSVTPGLGSFVFQPYPCISGDVVQYAFSDTACGQLNSASRTGTGYCYALVEGGDIAAIMLSCDQTSPGQPTSTTTITVGPIATGGSNSSTSSTTGSGDGSSSSSSNSSSPTSGWNSLSLPVRIVIIVGVSVGVLSVIAGGSFGRRRRNAAQATGHAYLEETHTRRIIT